MKFTTIILVSFVISINAFSQKLVRTYYDYGKTKIQAEYYTNAYGVKNGIFKGYSEYGGILLQGALKDGAAIGKWIENYEDGKLQCVKIYNSPGLGLGFGMNDGQVIEYYEDGKTIKSEKNYKNQEYDGDYKIYDENGTLTLEGKYVNGVLKLSEVFQRKYDEEQEKQKQLKREEEAATLKKKTEEYEKNILIADTALAAKDYLKAVRWYKSASKLLEKEKYPKDRISEMKETLLANSKFFDEYFKNDSLFNDFNMLKADFKIKIVKEYNKTTYIYDVKRPRINSYNCNCLEPWNESYDKSALHCFEINKEFYEPYQIAITEAFFQYKEVRSQEWRKYNDSDVSFDFKDDSDNSWDYKKANLHTYDKTTFLNNLKEAKENFELSKSLKTIYLKASENLVNDFNMLKADFKIKSVQEYNKSTSADDVKSPRINSYNCNCLEPWNESYDKSALHCFEINKEFYEPYQKAITEAFFKYKEALAQESRSYNDSNVTFEFKENFELSKSLKTNYLKALVNKVNITNLNEQNKKKTLLKKYLIVYEDLISKINAYPGLTETISLLKSLNSVSDKVVGLYSQETKELEKKLNDAETSEQIQVIFLGQ